MEILPLSPSQRMRRDAELRYDSVIPLEIRAAISAQERIESDLRSMRGMSEAERLRFLAAREFQLAKECFRSLTRSMGSGVFARPDRTWLTALQRARCDAEIHLECWRTLRSREYSLTAADRCSASPRD